MLINVPVLFSFTRRSPRRTTGDDDPFVKTTPATFVWHDEKSRISTHVIRNGKNLILNNLIPDKEDSL